MLTEAIRDVRAWTAATIDAPAAWHYPLPAACREAFEQMKPQAASAMLEVPAPLRAACIQSLRPVRDALESGRGFVIIDGPALPTDDASLMYWLVGQGLGQPFAQNVQGTMLYDVRDTGQEVAQGARFSVTNYESSFHTDNSFGLEVLDYVGLLCLQIAKSGGRSQIVSGYAAHNELLAHHREVLATLYEPFHVDRRGGVRAGDSPTVQFPVIQAAGTELVIRYLRYWIEAGHDKIGIALTPAQRSALDTLDAVLRMPKLRVEFDLKPGDMYFINNRWTLHNRTAFEDHAELQRRRHLVRLWLQRSPLAA